MGNSKRFLPHKKKNNSKKLTHDQVGEAIKKFKKEGGLIEQLPPEQVYSRRMVGNRWGSTYEMIFDHL